MSRWRPSSGPDAAARRAAMLQRIRNYFDQSGALEVDTPALSRSAVSDTAIESLAVDSSLTDAPLFLHTSPEFCMKRLLAAGYPDIYSICRVFRDGESGRHHQPEFTMLEWYRLSMQLDDIVRDTVRVIDAALGRTTDAGRCDRIEYRTAFVDACAIDPWNASVAQMAEAAGADDALQASLGDARNDWLDLLLSTRVIPSFAADRLTVLQHYPADQAALARRSPEDPELADRFEVFLGTVEIANGYVELTDAVEQRQRFDDDQQERRAHGKPLRPVDEDLIAALEHGLPQCGGVALGLERLQMIHDDTDNIRDVVTFAFDEKP